MLTKTWETNVGEYTQILPKLKEQVFPSRKTSKMGKSFNSNVVLSYLATLKWW